MPIDYKALSEENLRRYGTDISEWAPELLANLYHERTHFVFELLQNAEDALRRRNGTGPKSVVFALSQNGLKVSHFGKPFDEPDVRGICGINKSTKKTELTAIGRFGIGFKSVYSFTDRPEIHSVNEHFAIESFVRPVEIAPQTAQAGETVFWLPFRANDDKAFDAIAEGLESLSTSTLLFLREVEEVAWSVEDGASGSYCRDTVAVDQGLRRVTLLGQTGDQQEVETEEWLIFSRPVYLDADEVGAAEIGFALDEETHPNELRIRAVSDARLVAFFPTIVPTHLGFLLQAPYRTTPGRDNVPPKDAWNQYLVQESALLLVEALVELKDREALSIEVLSSLPIEESNFAEGTMFEPIYRGVAKALKEQPLLPTSEDSWVPSNRVAIARGQGLRELVNSCQLSNIFPSDTQLEWLSDEITLDRTPALRSYLMSEHEVREIQPTTFLSRVTKEFLEAQSDEWVSRLYQFLLGQPTLMKNMTIANKPWVRLENGSHVVAYTSEQPNAFLPSRGASGFPTVRALVCTNQEAIEFLRSLKLTEPDPVDDIIANVLPLYSGNTERDFDLYRQHLSLIEAAYSTPLRNQRTKLVAALRESNFVLAIDDDGNRSWLRPSDCYLPTDRLKKLFEGISGVNFVDDSVTGLQGEAIRDILIACGASRYLNTIDPEVGLSYVERRELRQKWGDSGCSGNELEDDKTLWGLDSVLNFISALPFDEAKDRSLLLWDALCDLIQDKRQNVVRATYYWFYYSRREIDHDAAFIRSLRSARWIPAPDGRLATPDEVVFEHIEPAWTPNAVLQNALGFKPPLVELLAKEVGLEPGLLNLLKKSGLTSEAQLRELLGIEENAEQQSEADSGEAFSEEGNSAAGDVEPSDDLNVHSPKPMSGSGQPQFRASAESVSPSKQERHSSDGSARVENSKAGQRAFISYLATTPLDEMAEDVSDSETQLERMRVEAIAIDYILTQEPSLQRTPPGNAGFDLVGINDDQQPDRWIEVKAMVGTLSNHPVGMSRRQFLEAQRRGTVFWLYIVENATSDTPCLLKIQDPAGNARTFTFDHGWRDIAIVTQVDVRTGEILEGTSLTS